MRVSILVNVLNGVKTISQAVASALSQSYPDFEVLVWDNGSADGTADLVASIEDPRVRVVRTDDTVPLYEARCRALAHCTGEFVAFLDADDWWRDDKLERQLELFEPGVDAVYSNYFVANEVAKSTRLYSRRKLPEGQIFSELLRRYRVGLLTLVVRRDVFERHRFDPGLEIIGDFDFVMRLARETEFRCVQEPLAWSRVHGDNESERKKSVHLRELASWCSQGESTGLLKGVDLRNMRRMVLAKQVEVSIDAGHLGRALAEFARVRPVGRQVKVAQRVLTTWRSRRNLSVPIDRPR